MRRGGKNDSGREDQLSSEIGGEERVTKSCISCESHSASSSSSDISTVPIFGLRGRKSGADLMNKTDSLLGFGVVAEIDEGICSSSEIFGVRGSWPNVSSLEDEEAALETDEARECVHLRKRVGTTLVAGLRVKVTLGSLSRGGQGKSKDFPARESVMSLEAERLGGWGARRGGEEKKDSSEDTAEQEASILRSHVSSSSGSEGKTFDL